MYVMPMSECGHHTINILRMYILSGWDADDRSLMNRFNITVKKHHREERRQQDVL